MKIFSPMYDWVLKWSTHPLAVRYLALISFLESIIFPIPVDVMLAPMALAKPHRAWSLAAITTLASVAGGIVGFMLVWLIIGYSGVLWVEVANTAHTVGLISGCLLALLYGANRGTSN